MREAARFALVSALALALLLVGLPLVRAEEQSPYRITEFVVHAGPGIQWEAEISGRWAVWHDHNLGLKAIAGRNLDTGLDFTINTQEAVVWPVAVGGDLVVALEAKGVNEFGIFGYRLPEGTRFTIAPFQGGDKFLRTPPRLSGNTVVWAEGQGNNTNIHIYDLVAQRVIAVHDHPAQQSAPDVSGDYVVWLDQRHTADNSLTRDIYGLNLVTGREFRVTPNSERVTAPAISGNVVVWSYFANRASNVVGYNIAEQRVFTIAGGLYTTPSIDGDLLAWSAGGEFDEDIFAYDMRTAQRFVVSRAVGAQTAPKVSGRTIVWQDGRHSGGGKYDYDADVYGARLEPGPAPLPPAYGAPSALDAKIEIVWPHNGAPVTEADKANIGLYLFHANTLNPVPCPWNPRVQLWRAIDDEPAQMVAMATKGYAPKWEFNDVDVSVARDPNRRLYFFATVDGVPTARNVWAHAADARTYFPHQDSPTGIAPPTGTVAAKIEIVYPHDNAPVAQAKKANIGALLFTPGTLQSVPPDWNPTVRLLRSLNNDVAEEVAIGEKVLVATPAFTYPTWQFNNVDVSAANDPANKLYFSLAVDGVTTLTNVWSHGADARTYFPQQDVPAQSCVLPR